MYLNNAVLVHGEASPGVQNASNASVAVPEEAVTPAAELVVAAKDLWRPACSAPLGPRYTHTSAVILVGAYSSHL